MITTYAVSFSTVDCTEAQRIALVDLVTDWQMANHPFSADDPTRPGTSMRVREGDDDPVFRLTLTSSDDKSSHADTTTVTVALIDDVLTFDLRVVSSPRTTRVAPYTPPLVPLHVAQLVRDVLVAVPTFDADYQVLADTRIASTELQGQELAAFVFAARRRLPVVVEIDDFDRGGQPLVASRPGPLAGLAHVWRITSPEAMRAFVDGAGLPLVDQATVLVLWDPRSEPEIIRRREITRGTEQKVWTRLVSLVTTTAARSVAQPRVPPPPRRALEPEPAPRAAAAGDTDDPNADDLEDMAAHVEQLEATVDDLQAALADADRIIADQRAKLERKDSQLDELVLRTVSLETQKGATPQSVAVASMKEALRLAQKHCPHLVFHPRAIESGEALEGPDPGSVLSDLVRLNEVARAWRSGEITGSSIGLACRQMGLDFAPGVSATARQKYVEDYIIDWRGKSVVAGAHIRRGRKAHLVRIHLYFDAETEEVVVAYIGRHLRDKGSAA